MQSLRLHSSLGLDSDATRHSLAPVPFDNASWRNGTLSDWSVLMGSGDNMQLFRVHKFALGLGDRASAFFYTHFNQPSELLAHSNTTHLEVGRAFLCCCGSQHGVCCCSSAVQDRIVEVDRMLLIAFEEVLEYIYEGTLEPAEHCLMSMWALADYLQITSLSERIRELFDDIVSKENAHRLLADCLRLNFGGAYVIRRCLRFISISFASYTFEQLSAFGPDIVMAIITHSDLDENSSAVASFISKFIRLNGASIDRRQFIDFMTFLDKYGISGHDALYLVKMIRAHLTDNSRTSSCKPENEIVQFEEDKELLKTLQTRCFDSIAAGLDSIDSQAFSQLPLDVAVAILRLDTLSVNDEDEVFRLILDFVSNSKTGDLQEAEIVEIWSTCRFAFLSAPVLYEASLSPDVPRDLLLRGAIAYKMLQHQQEDELGGVDANWLSVNASMRPRLTSSFNERLLSTSLLSSNNARTVRLIGTMGHCTAFSQHVIHIDTVGSKAFYWEFRIEGARSVEGIYLGVSSTPLSQYQSTFHIGSSSLVSWSMQASSGKKFHSGRGRAYGLAFGRGDIVGMALHCNNGVASLTFYKNGKSMGDAFARVQGSVVPAVTLFRKEQQVTLMYKSNLPPTHTGCHSRGLRTTCRRSNSRRRVLEHRRS